MPLRYTKDLMREAIIQAGYTIGDFTYGLPNIMAWGEGYKFHIGRYCSIAAGVSIFLGGNHRTDWVTTYPFSAINDTWPEAVGIVGHPHSRGDVVIGNDVWLGAQSTIMSGVKIGDGAVVAAHAVVTKDVAPYAIVGGNPARLIRYRFGEATIQGLLKVRWWDWSEEAVRRIVPYLVSSDIEAFLRKAEEVIGQTRGGHIDEMPLRA
jgi:acetyltransferase-like isoleucine patch superfamily enzyme